MLPLCSADEPALQTRRRGWLASLVALLNFSLPGPSQELPRLSDLNAVKTHGCVTIRLSSTYGGCAADVTAPIVTNVNPDKDECRQRLMTM